VVVWAGSLTTMTEASKSSFSLGCGGCNRQEGLLSPLLGHPFPSSALLAPSWAISTTHVPQDRRVDGLGNAADDA
jgi:hypothetical protein